MSLISEVVHGHPGREPGSNRERQAILGLRRRADKILEYWADPKTVPSFGSNFLVAVIESGNLPKALPQDRAIKTISESLATKAIGTVVGDCFQSSQKYSGTTENVMGQNAELDALLDGQAAPEDAVIVFTRKPTALL